MMKDYELVLQPRGTCEQCPWTVGPGPLTRERAMNHGTTRRHTVRVITEHVEFWKPVESFERFDGEVR